MGSRIGKPTLGAKHPLIQFVPALLIATVACVLRWCLSNAPRERRQPRNSSKTARRITAFDSTGMLAIIPQTVLTATAPRHPGKILKNLWHRQYAFSPFVSGMP
jgi:hypothetical protein